MVFDMYARQLSYTASQAILIFKYPWFSLLQKTKLQMKAFQAETKRC